MPLSTLTQCQPRVCSLQLQLHPHGRLSSTSAPAALDWNRVWNAAQIAAAATAVSQLVSAPLDVAARAMRSGSCDAPHLARAVVQIARRRGVGALFNGLPMHLLKRVPTKALTVALFELGTHLVAQRPRRALGAAPQRSAPPLAHVAVATVSGALALLATYPIHLSYFAMRKGLPFAAVVARAVKAPQVLYAGAVPAVIGTAPAVLVDYIVYRTFREKMGRETCSVADANAGAEGKRRAKMAAMTDATLIIAAAVMSNLMGGFFSEPFKALSRRAGVETLRRVDGATWCAMAGRMLGCGMGEFWRGFPLRSVRYAVSAVVSKTTVQKLKHDVSHERCRYAGTAPHGLARGTELTVGPRRGYAAAHLVSPKGTHPRVFSQYHRS